MRQPTLPVQGVPIQRPVIDWSHCLRKSEEVKSKEAEPTPAVPTQEPQVTYTPPAPQNELNLQPMGAIFHSRGICRIA